MPARLLVYEIPSSKPFGVNKIVRGKFVFDVFKDQSRMFVRPVKVMPWKRNAFRKINNKSVNEFFFIFAKKLEKRNIVAALVKMKKIYRDFLLSEVFT